MDAKDVAQLRRLEEYLNFFLNFASRPDLSKLQSAKIKADARRFVYLMRKHQMLPLTFYGGKYL